MIFQSFLAEVSVNKWGVWQGGHMRLENVCNGGSPVMFFHPFQVTLEDTVLENLVRTVLGTSTNLSFLWANI